MWCGTKMPSRFNIETYTNEIPNAWQSFADNIDTQNIFQTSQWAKAVRKVGLGILLTVAMDEEGAVRGGILGTYAKLSFLRLEVIPVLQVWGGPILLDMNDKHLAEILLRVFEKEAREKGVISCYIRSFAQLDDILVNRLDYKLESYGLPCTLIVDLTGTEDELWRQLQERGRRGIRKALKKGVVIEQGNTSEDLLTYYEMSRSTARRLGIAPVPFKLMTVLWKIFSPNDQFKLFLAKHQGEAIAGVIIVRWKDKMWGWHGASLSRSWSLNANVLLHWNIIQWGARNQVRTYDLMGIPCEKDSSHPKYGLYLFKTQLGGKIVRHGEYTKILSLSRHLLLTRVFRPINRELQKPKITEENLELTPLDSKFF